MNQKSIKKIKKTSKIAIFIVLLCTGSMLLIVGNAIRSTFRNGGLRAFFSNSVVLATSITNFVFFIGILIVGVLMYKMLRSIQNEQSPFTLQNVKYLKGTGITMIIMELWEVLWGRFFSGFIFTSGDPIITTIFTVNSMGGIIIIIGVVIYCVAMVFEYGICLQQESDETL